MPVSGYIYIYNIYTPTHTHTHRFPFFFFIVIKFRYILKKISESDINKILEFKRQLGKKEKNKRMKLSAQGSQL